MYRLPSISKTNILFLKLEFLAYSVQYLPHRQPRKLTKLASFPKQLFPTKRRRQTKLLKFKICTNLRKLIIKLMAATRLKKFSTEETEGWKSKWN